MRRRCYRTRASKSSDGRNFEAFHFEREQVADDIVVSTRFMPMDARRRQIRAAVAVEPPLHPRNERFARGEIRPGHAGGRHHAGAQSGRLSPDFRVLSDLREIS